MATRPPDRFFRNIALATVAAVVMASIAAAATVLLVRHLRPAATAARGAIVYEAHCIGCHGAKLEGQSEWRHVGRDGRLPAPPLDGTGHAWRHSDAELAHLIGFSVLDQAGPGYQTDMPAFSGTLTDADIRSLILYIKTRWPSGIQAAQAFLNPDHAGMPQRIEGDWRLPPDCEEPIRGAAPSSTP